MIIVQITFLTFHTNCYASERPDLIYPISKGDKEEEDVRNVNDQFRNVFIFGLFASIIGQVSMEYANNMVKINDYDDCY